MDRLIHCSYRLLRGIAGEIGARNRHLQVNPEAIAGQARAGLAQTQKTPPKRGFGLVAGAGFEPATFRL
jgi:hypothetical protein